VHDPPLGWREPNFIFYQQFLEGHEKIPSEKKYFELLLNNLPAFKSN
jgi:hypothetical protein